MTDRHSIRPRVVGRRALLVAVAGGLLVAPRAVAVAQSTPAAGSAPALPEPGPLPTVAPRDGGPLPVVTTIGILADMVRHVGGERVAVDSLLPANVDPHEFEPTPQDVVKAEAAKLIVQHGLGLDHWAEVIIASADSGAPVVTATDGIATLTAGGGGAPDPHVWFDPRRAKVMIENIAKGLAAADPAGEAAYRTRSDAYQAELAALDTAIAAAIETIPPERRKLVTSHDALAYYADRYGLTIVGTVIPGLDTSAEPSASELAKLVAAVSAQHVPAIFAENTTSPALSERVAAEAGVHVVDTLYTDSLGPAGSGADTYLGLLRTDTEIIVGALR